MIKWFRLIKWVKQQRKNGYYGYKVVSSESEFIIWNSVTNDELRIKY